MPDLEADLNTRYDNALRIMAEKQERTPEENKMIAEVFFEALIFVKPQFDEMKRKIIVFCTPFEDEHGRIWEPVSVSVYAQTCVAYEAIRSRYTNLRNLMVEYFGRFREMDIM